MPVSDRAIGLSLFVLSISIFAYFTTWLLVLPFIDVDSPVQRAFPPRFIGLAIPALALSLGVSVIGAFAGSVALRAATGSDGGATSHREKRKHT